MSKRKSIEELKQVFKKLSLDTPKEEKQQEIPLKPFMPNPDHVYEKTLYQYHLNPIHAQLVLYKPIIVPISSFDGKDTLPIDPLDNHPTDPDNQPMNQPEMIHQMDIDA